MGAQMNDSTPVHFLQFAARSYILLTLPTHTFCLSYLAIPVEVEPLPLACALLLLQNQVQYALCAGYIDNSHVLMCV